MKTSGKKLSELSKFMTHYPQVLKNIVVKEKKPLDQMKQVSKAIKDAETILGDEGRILVRYSGTEKKCRVMLEGKDKDKIERIADSIAEKIRAEIGE